MEELYKDHLLGHEKKRQSSIPPGKQEAKEIKVDKEKKADAKSTQETKKGS